MDEVKTSEMPTSQTDKKAARPAITSTDLTTSNGGFTTHSAFNDFLLRLEQLKKSHPDWDDPRNQSRPFKQTFVDFLHRLILRLPVPPEITPMANGTVRLRYRKRAPRDKWQILEFVVYPQRYFEMTAKSRIPKQAPFQRTNLARPDYMSDMVQAFYELDYVNTKEHPLRFRPASVIDLNFISAMCQMTFGPHNIYHPRNISKLSQYCYVADDPLYGIVSVAAISEDSLTHDYVVNILITAQNYRGLSLSTKCLRKCVNEVLKDHPDATIRASVPLRWNEAKDVAHSAMKRAGFKKEKIVKGEKRYQCFDCDRCNTQNGYCDFYNPNTTCSTVHYVLIDKNKKPAQA